MIEVDGWEDSAGFHKYNGKICHGNYLEKPEFYTKLFHSTLFSIDLTRSRQHYIKNVSNLHGFLHIIALIELRTEPANPNIEPNISINMQLLTFSTTVAIAYLLSSASALGINCRVSGACGLAISGNSALELSNYINNIDDGRYYQNGEHIACTTSYANE